MAINRTPPLAPPLEERIAALRADLDEWIDARVEVLRQQTPGVPPGVIRGLITAGGGGCQCQSVIEIKKGDVA